MSARIGGAIVAAAATKLAVNATNPRAFACPPTCKVRWYTIDCAVISRFSSIVRCNCAKSL
jgi:hypothetical protein